MLVIVGVFGFAAIVYAIYLGRLSSRGRVCEPEVLQGFIYDAQTIYLIEERSYT